MIALTKHITWWVMILLIMTIDLTLVKSVPLIHVCVDGTILTIMLVTIFRGLVKGFIASLVAAGLWSMMSLVPWGIHLTGCVAVTLIAWTCHHRLFTHHSPASFLATIMLTTTGYYVVMAGVGQVVHLVDNSVFIPTVFAYTPYLLVQSILHPFLALIGWKALGGSSSHTATVARPISY